VLTQAINYFNHAIMR